MRRMPLRTFWYCTRGNFVAAIGILVPILLGLAGGVVDLFVYEHHRSELQAVADAGVLAAAQEAGLKGWSEETAKQVVASVVGTNLTNRFSNAIFAYDIKVQEEERRISLTLTQDHYGYFFLGYFTGSPQIRVGATASATGQAILCIVVQSPTGSRAFSLNGNSHIFASGCSAYSNSVNSKGMEVKDSSTLRTQMTCSAGGYGGTSSGFSPLPLTDCPALADPLAARATLVDIAITETCDFTNLKLKGENKTMGPGTYCGGLQISDGAQVQLEPGIYVFKGGKLRLDKSSVLRGSGVGFVFIGDKAILEFKNESTVSLSAPTEGPMAGILMYAQTNSKKHRTFMIASKDAEKLIGTVYLPDDQLLIGGDKDGDGICDPEVADDGTIIPAAPGGCVSEVGAASAWTAIVVDELKVTAGSTLVLNSDYESSTIPVPDGIGPNSTKIILVD
jgi:hypothetical protein